RSLLVPIPTYMSITNLAINLPEFPCVDLSIKNISNDLVVNLDKSIDKTVNSIKFNKLNKDFGKIKSGSNGLDRIFRILSKNKIDSQISKMSVYEKTK